jgi:hypothetical protein
MKTGAVILLLISLISCSTEKPKFKKEKVCSLEALRYLRNPRNKYKDRTVSSALVKSIADNSRSMQLCYEDFKNRTGLEEFNTCLVVGIDDYGEMEFYNFGSREVTLDESFIKCAKAVTKSVPYSSFGTNYILIQSYQFYVGN